MMKLIVTDPPGCNYYRILAPEIDLAQSRGRTIAPRPSAHRNGASTDCLPFQGALRGSAMLTKTRSTVGRMHEKGGKPSASDHQDFPFAPARVDCGEV
jgi:hypothetical protein